MRLNKFVAQATGLSRRNVDKLLEEKRITVNGQTAVVGQQIRPEIDEVMLDSNRIQATASKLLVAVNKPVGYVSSREGQGSKTIYDLLPSDYHHLKPVGRLDKDSSGLLLMTNDGDLANQLSHPRYNKVKYYEVTLDRNLSQAELAQLNRDGVVLSDGLSKPEVREVNRQDHKYSVSIAEGRNRQVRRTFAAIDRAVVRLHRTKFGPYEIGKLPGGKFKLLDTDKNNE